MWCQMKEPRMGHTDVFPIRGYKFGAADCDLSQEYHKKLLVLAGLKAHNLILGKEAPRTTLEVLLR